MRMLGDTGHLDIGRSHLGLGQLANLDRISAVSALTAPV